MARPKAVEVHARIQRAIGQMYNAYGAQGWWPVECERDQFDFPEGAREREGYHPNATDFPRTRFGRFEIVCGAVLTQNTAWQNVQKALRRLREREPLSPEILLELPAAELSELIRPVGYFNQKQGYLRAVSQWFIEHDGAIVADESSHDRLTEIRERLLAVRGIGPETADSILLYAYALPTFVVDAYTRRVFGRLGVVGKAESYEEIRCRFSDALRAGLLRETVQRYQEAHAIIVEHAKRYHGRNADPSQDFLLEVS